VKLGRSHGLDIERLPHLAGGGNALPHRSDQRALHARRGLHCADVGHILQRNSTDFENVGKAFGDEQPRLGTIALDQRVGGNGAAMPEILDLAG
jgi:hypothetical protein